MKQPDNLPLEERLTCIRETVSQNVALAGRNPEDIRIMAVTKNVPAEQVNQAVKWGISFLGENRVQEYLEKRAYYCLPSGEVHFIGHLQRNKVKYIIDKVDMIQSVSSLELAEEIQKRAMARRKAMRVLLEINISEEQSKSGFFESETEQAVEKILSMSFLQLEGMMCIPAKNNAEASFVKMRELYDRIRFRYRGDLNFQFLSMGMSADYSLAVREGSNLIRLGTAIFGQRNTGGK